jgi:UDP-glucuronate 4-epimerase
LRGEPIRVFNHGKHRRSFTYIDDIVEGVVRALDGNEEPMELLRYIEVIEKCLGRTAKMEMLPLQADDVLASEADVSELIARVGYWWHRAGASRRRDVDRPKVSVQEGRPTSCAGTETPTPLDDARRLSVSSNEPSAVARSS